jgi:hypothetical protein
MAQLFAVAGLDLAAALAFEAALPPGAGALREAGFGAFPDAAGPEARQAYAGATIAWAKAAVALMSAGVAWATQPARSSQKAGPAEATA